MPTGHRKGKNAFLIRPASLCFAAVHASLDILTHPSSGFQGCSLGGPVFLHAFPRPPAPPHRADTPDPDPNTSARSAGPSKLATRFHVPRPHCQSAAPCRDLSSDRPVPRCPEVPTAPHTPPPLQGRGQALLPTVTGLPPAPRPGPPSPCTAPAANLPALP